MMDKVIWGVQIVPNGYKNFDTKKNLDDLSKEELKELVKFYKSNWVYFANYSIKSDTIEHHRITATEPSDWGTTVIRGFEFNGDILYLIPRDALTNKKTRLCWKKLK